WELGPLAGTSSDRVRALAPMSSVPGCDRSPIPSNRFLLGLHHLFCRHLRLPLRLLPRLALVESQDRELPTDQKDCGASTECNRRRTMRTLLINPVRSQPPHRISNNTSSRLL